MPFNGKALVLDGAHQPFRLIDLVVDDPLPDEVLVRMVSSGICHSDLSVQSGAIPNIRMPSSLGHEGAGVVAKVGASVTGLKEGDKVLLGFNWCTTCRRCSAGQPAACADWINRNFNLLRNTGNGTIGADKATGERINGAFFGQSSFSEYAICSPTSCVKVPDDTPIKLLAPLGCGMSTGAGAILNVLQPKPGQTVGIWGMGGVGMAALMAAVSLGATVIAVDIVPSRLRTALELGAAHCINGMDADISEQIFKITNGDMLDFTLDASGVIQCIEAAWMCLGRYGVHGQLGAPAQDRFPKFNMQEAMNSQKTFKGIMLGDTHPHTFLPRLIEMHRDGMFPVEKLVTFYPIGNFKQAMDAMHDGTAIKPILVF